MRALVWVFTWPRRLKSVLDSVAARFGYVRVVIGMALVALLIAEALRAVIILALGANG